MILDVGENAKPAVPDRWVISPLFHPSMLQKFPPGEGHAQIMREAVFYTTPRRL